MRLVSQIKNHCKEINFGKDIVSGIIVALVSIPISMGYAQVAGLPVVYGLYGSLLPILIFGLLSTSPQFVVGVDAMPAVIVGGLLAELGIAAESEQALGLVPLISIMVALWFIVFYLFKAGRVVKYISTPVMGGFISGVGLTIILMQVPKLFGGSSGTGQVFELLEHIAEQMPQFNLLSAIFGISTIIIILVCKKIIPKVPVAVIMMVVGAVMQAVFHLNQYGVKMLPEVSGGLPKLMLPDITLLSENTTEILMQSLSIAAVVMAQTLLATGNYAMKYNYKVDNNAELLAYAGMNFASGIVGCCPINGSVSRSGIADSFGCSSQIMSVASSVTMLFVILFGTPLLKYLPVPILTGIVMTALIGILEINMFKKLWKAGKNEWITFMTAFLAVLIFGTVYGVVIGVILAFGQVAIRAVTPPTSFVGRIPGQGNFYALERNTFARPIKNTIIYRFSGNLFFANIDTFQNDIEGAINSDTRQIIVDARGIGSIDITAIDRLVVLNRNLRARGIHFYLTEHDGTLNDQIRLLGGESLIYEGVVRRTITLALKDAGVNKPYQLEGGENEVPIPVETDEKLSEFEWAFGSDAEDEMEKLANAAAEEITKPDAVEEKQMNALDSNGLRTAWGVLGLFDENEFLDHLEVRLEEMVNEGKLPQETVDKWEKHIEERRLKSEGKLKEINPHALELLMQHREEIREHIKLKHPKEYEHIVRLRKELNLDKK